MITRPMQSRIIRLKHPNGEVTHTYIRDISSPKVCDDIMIVLREGYDVHIGGCLDL